MNERDMNRPVGPFVRVRTVRMIASQESVEERIQGMDRSKKTPSEAATAEPRHDRQLAVLLEGVLDLELAAARHQLEEAHTPPGLVERALRLLRTGQMPESFLASPFEPDLHGSLVDLTEETSDTD